MRRSKMKTKELFQKAIRFPKWHRIRSNFVHLDNFGPAELNNINYVLLSNSVFSDLVYKDETWNYIANLDEYRAAMKEGKNLRYPDNKCNYGNKCEAVSYTHLVSEGKVVELKCDSLHFDFKSLDTWTSKHNWYSTKEASDYELSLIHI